MATDSIIKNKTCGRQPISRIKPTSASMINTFMVIEDKTMHKNMSAVTVSAPYDGSGIGDIAVLILLHMPSILTDEREILVVN